MEGNITKLAFSAAPVCQRLWTNRTIGRNTPPFFQYTHSQQFDPTSPCPTGGAVTGIEFIPRNGYGFPVGYQVRCRALRGVADTFGRVT
jgi:hypothetical protein